METYTGSKGFVPNPGFETQRQKAVQDIDLGTIDKPIAGLIMGFKRLPFCFTLQSCYGHFIYKGQDNPCNTDPIRKSEDIGDVDYKIAYIALCIQDSDPGRELFNQLRKVPEIDPGYIQFGCARWFWEQQVNSYVLQVEPSRYRFKDRITMGYREALRIEKTRDIFFRRLENAVLNM